MGTSGNQIQQLAIAFTEGEQTFRLQGFAHHVGQQAEPLRFQLCLAGSFMAGSQGGLDGAVIE